MAKKLNKRQRNSILDHLALKVRCMDPQELTSLSIPKDMVVAVKRELEKIADYLVSHIDG